MENIEQVDAINQRMTKANRTTVPSIKTPHNRKRNRSELSCRAITASQRVKLRITSQFSKDATKLVIFRVFHQRDV